MAVRIYLNASILSEATDFFKCNHERGAKYFASYEGCRGGNDFAMKGLEAVALAPVDYPAFSSTNPSVQVEKASVLFSGTKEGSARATAREAAR